MVSCVKPGGRPAPHRYKGVEGLLRRIAFNLGNSPSQTEVKIISCIPIDVTDLQQKIICLEKQLEAVQCRNNRSKAAVFPLMVDRTPLHVAYPSSAATATPEANVKKPLNQETRLQSSDANKNEPRLIVARELNSYLKDCQAANQTIFEKQIPEKDLTKLVYYAQTATGNPFTNYKKLTSKNYSKMSETIDQTYLKSIINKQYQSGGMYIDDGSQLSAPICRDVPRCATTSDDMCSCCQGHFVDVDREQHKRLCYTANVDSRNIYYDSSFYDMKPVKEEPNTSKRCDLPMRRGPEIDLAFYPEYYRFNPTEYLSSHPRSKSVKFPKKKERLPKPVFIQNDSSQTDGLVEFSRVYTRPSPGRLGNSTDKSMSRTAECNARSEINTVNYMGPSKLIQTLSLEKFPSTSATLNKKTSQNAVSVTRATKETEYHARTAKALQTMSLSKLGSNTVHKVTFKNAEVLALGLNETECQTDPAKYSESTSPPQPDKTESTLDQIKSILETVLTEVKTNSRMRPAVDAKETKDAVVQNESPSSPDCERLLGSFTYSGFPINNPYVTSCSGGVPTYCSSVMRQTLTMPPPGTDRSPDMNCVQNFPVFVQRTLATQHTCCSDRGQAKQTSTNTLHEPPPKKRTTETENLIKEIYKSMALNVDDPIKTTSREVVDEGTSVKARKAVQSESVGANTMTLGREEIIYRGNVGPSRFTTRILACPSSHSSLTMRRHRRSGSFHQPLRQITSSAQRRQFNVLEARTRPVEDSPESASDSESEVAAVIPSFASPTKSPPELTSTKKGFFGKVMSSVMKRMRRKEEQLPQNPEKHMDAIAEDSDSEFETIHQKVDKPVKHVSYAPAHHSPWKSIMHSANTAARASTSKSRRLSGAGTPAKPARSERGRVDESTRQPPRMPKYVPPRSAMRPHPATSQVRRAIHRPNPPHRPHTPPDYMRRVPHNQYEWRTTPNPCVDASFSAPSNEYKPKVKANQGIKLTNKTWMRKPVHHLGFACGPEKTKILMQRY